MGRYSYHGDMASHLGEPSNMAPEPTRIGLGFEQSSRLSPLTHNGATPGGSAVERFGEATRPIPMTVRKRIPDWTRYAGRAVDALVWTLQLGGRDTHPGAQVSSTVPKKSSRACATWSGASRAA